jgi:fucose permease
VLVEKQFRPLFAALLMSFIAFGACVTIIGATVPDIVRGFEWSYTAMGLLLSSGSMAYFIAAFASGILIRKLGARRMIVGGLILQAAGLVGFATMPQLWANIPFYVMLGLGQGAMEVVINHSVARMEPGGKSRAMNLMHAAFTVGAILGPLLLVALVAAGMNWATIYRLMALVTLVMAVALSRTPFGRLATEEEHAEGGPGMLHLLSRPLMIMCTLLLLLYVGAELGVSSWVSEYYVTVLRQAKSTGAVMVAVFWVGLLIGRLALSYGYHGHRQAELLFVLGVICAAGLLFATHMSDPWLAGAGFFVAGLGYSAMYPLVIVLVAERFKRASSIAVGVVTMGGGLGSFTFPFIMGAVSDRYGLPFGFWFYAAVNVLMVVLTVAIICHVRSLGSQNRHDASGTHRPDAPR